MEMLTPQRSALSHGSIVALVAGNQQLVARPRAKSGWAAAGWELKAVSLQGDDSGGEALGCLPVEALFVVLRRGEQFGFKALGAEGRTIQAVEALNEGHRIYNHNFGTWESWEEVGDELVNSHWRHKKLGYKIKPVLAVPGEVLARLDLQHKKVVLRLNKQVEKLGGAALLEGGQGPVASWEAREMESLRRQLAESSRSLRHWQQEAAARQEVLEELQAKLQEQQGGRLRSMQAGMGFPSQAAVTIASLRADLREAQAQHAAQLGEEQQRHQQQLEALRQEHACMLSELLEQQGEQRGRAAQQQQQPQQQQGPRDSRAADGSAGPVGAAGPAGATPAEQELRQQVEMLQRQLAMAGAERAAAVGEVRAEMQAALHAKDEEYHRILMSKDAEMYWLLEERQRLDLTLHTIKDMTVAVRQASPPNSGGTPCPPPLQQQQQQRQQGEGRELREVPQLQSPSVTGPLHGHTVLGVPVHSEECCAAAIAASPSPDSGAGSHIRALPRMLEQELQQQGQQPGPLPVAAEAGCSEAGSRGGGTEAQGSCGDASQPGETSPSFQGERSCTLSAMAAAVAAAAARRDSSPPPPLVQPWEVHGAQQLGSPIEGTIDAATSAVQQPGALAVIAQEATGPPAQTEPSFKLASSAKSGPAQPCQPAELPPGSAASTADWGLQPPQDLLAPGKSRLSQEGSANAAALEQPGTAAAEGGAVEEGPGTVQKGAPEVGSGASKSTPPRPAVHHPVFNPDVRARISNLYDMLNPFAPSSMPSSPRSRLTEEQRRLSQDDYIRVSQQRGQRPVLAGPQLRAAQPGHDSRRGGWGAVYHTDGYESDSADSMHRVPIGDSYLVDYNGTRPDSLTEETMRRILDGPLPGPEDGEEALRWRRRQQQQQGGSAAPSHLPACSAPASVASSDASPASPPAPGAGGWASGSLSLPGSTRPTPLQLESDKRFEVVGALGDLPKEQVAARRNRELGPAPQLFPPTQAVKAMQERSPPGADAVATYMADHLTMRASMPDGGWLGGMNSQRRRDLLPELSRERAQPARKAEQASYQSLRKSAPARPGGGQGWSSGSGGAARSTSSLRRSSFLSRPPVAVEALYSVE